MIIFKNQLIIIYEVLRSIENLQERVLQLKWSLQRQLIKNKYKKTLGKTRLHIQRETKKNCEESLAIVKKGLQDKCLVN